MLPGKLSHFLWCNGIFISFLEIGYMYLELTMPSNLMAGHMAQSQSEPHIPLLQGEWASLSQQVAVRFLLGLLGKWWSFFPDTQHCEDLGAIGTEVIFSSCRAGEWSQHWESSAKKHTEIKSWWHCFQSWVEIFLKPHLSWTSLHKPVNLFPL